KAFVGRETELQLLESLASRTFEAEQGSVVFLTGEAGVGKSELINQLRDRVLRKYPDIRLAVGYCNELTRGGDPYQPFFDILDELVTAEKREGTDRFLQFIREMGPEWVQVVPGIGSLLSATWKTTQWVRTELLSKAVLDASQIDPHTILRQYTRILQRISTLNPLMLVVEDLQWADTSSVNLLFHLARNLGSCPVFIIGTYRPSEIEIRRHSMKQVEAEMKRYKLCQKVSLAHLEKGDVIEYLEAEFPNNTFDRTFFDLLYDKTEGNPLFVVEAINLLREQRIIVYRRGLWQLAKGVADIDIPPAIAGVIEKRIGYLRNKIRRVLQYASVEGEIFSSATLARLLHWEELTLLEELEVLERIHRLIEELETEGILTKSGMRYQFIHSLVHKTFYNTLNARQKQLLHKKLGEILETEYAEDRERIATQLAVHFEKGREFDKAIEYRVIAARKANDLYSFSESAEHCQIGLTLLGRLEDSNTNKQKRIDVLLERGRADEAVGKVDEAIDRYASCEALSFSISDKQRLSNIYYRWGSALYRKSEYEGSIEYLERSLRLREELNDRAGIADALEALGTNYTYYQDRWRGALEVFERSQQVREELGDHRGKGRILANLGVIYHKHGRDDDALVVCREALTIQQRIGDVLGQALSLFTFGRVHLVRCEWNSALSHYRKSLELAERIDDPTLRIEILTGLGDWHRRQQRFGEALQYFEDALELSRAVGNKNGIAWLLCLTGRVLKEQGKTEEALSTLNDSLETYKEIGGWTGEALVSKAMAGVYLHTGDLEKAGRLLERALQIEKNIETPRDILSTLLGLSKVYLANHQYDQALLFISQLLVLSEQIGVPSEVSTIGDAQLTKARILLSKEDYQEALESVRSAHTIYQKLELATGVVETKMVEAEIMLAAGDNREKAVNLLAEVSKAFEKEGLEDMRKKAVSILRKAGAERTVRTRKKGKEK
ncbi:tetratricopeptide repeat protein, partial [candidate division TA06 bacterium]